jgi:hypothetical protein
VIDLIDLIGSFSTKIFFTTIDLPIEDLSPHKDHRRERPDQVDQVDHEIDRKVVDQLIQSRRRMGLGRIQIQNDSEFSRGRRN